MEENICFYGCGQQASTYFKSTNRWCCSTNVNQCPAKRVRDSEKKKGKNPFKGKVHPRGMLGKKSWNSGKKGIFSEEHKKKISATLSGRKNGPLSEEHKQKISDGHKKNGLGGGLREGSGVGQKTWYESPIAGKMYLQSSYELRIAHVFDRLGIQWSRNVDSFSYEWIGNRKYYPDFKVGDVYIETKGFVSTKDVAKWSVFPHDLRIVMESNLVALEAGEIDIASLPTWQELLTIQGLKITNPLPKILKTQHTEV